MSNGYMLDTNILVFALRRTLPSLRDRMKAAHGSLLVSTISVSELRYGADRSSDPMRNRIATEDLLTQLTVVPFDKGAAEHAGEIRAELAQRGTPIGGYDLLLAGHARAAGHTMVTNNIREFTRVPGLVVEDWTATGPVD